jgi:hypothetical protein
MTMLCIPALSKPSIKAPLLNHNIIFNYGITNSAVIKKLDRLCNDFCEGVGLEVLWRQHLLKTYFYKLPEGSQSLMRAAMTQLNLSVRDYHRTQSVKLARTQGTGGD